MQKIGVGSALTGRSRLLQETRPNASPSSTSKPIPRSNSFHLTATKSAHSIFAIMPHSVSPEVSMAEDIILPDAPADPLIEEPPSSPPDGLIATDGTSDAKKEFDQVKLEDLFRTDDEDDEEFPISSAPSGNGKTEQSSPPAEPV